MKGLIPGLTFLILLLLRGSTPLPQVVKIGGIFDEGGGLGEEDDDEQGLLRVTAFKHALTRLNSNLSILPRTQLSPLIHVLAQGDSFTATAKVCEMVGDGIMGLLSPGGPGSSSSHLQSIAQALAIPYIQTSPVSLLDLDLVDSSSESSSDRSSSTIHFYPHPRSIGRVVVDLIQVMDWTHVDLLVEDEEEGLLGLQEVIAEVLHPSSGRSLLIHQLPHGQELRPLLREIQGRSPPDSLLLLHCGLRRSGEILGQSQQVGLMTRGRPFLLTHLDFHALWLDPFKYSDVRIYGLRMVDPQRPEVEGVLSELRELLLQGVTPRGQRSGQSDHGPLHLQTLPFETALIYDGVMALGTALHSLDTSQRIEEGSLRTCESNRSWTHGPAIVGHILLNEFHGLSGLLRFNSIQSPRGFRTDIGVDVLQLMENGPMVLGSWTPGGGSMGRFGWRRSHPVSSVGLQQPLQQQGVIPWNNNQSLIMTTTLSPPFCGFGVGGKLEGFGIELGHLLAQALGLSLQTRLVVVERGQGQGPWEGMVQEVMDGTASFALGDLTITKERIKSVDFTQPFMTFDLELLFEEEEGGGGWGWRPWMNMTLTLLRPFELKVWGFIGLAWLGVTLTLFIIGRVTPNEWRVVNVGGLCDRDHPPSPPGHHHTKGSMVNDLDLRASSWLLLCGLLHQPTGLSDPHPKALCTRVVSGVWGLFVLLILSTYTANLSSLLLLSDGRGEGQGRTPFPLEEFLRKSDLQIGVHNSSLNFLKVSLEGGDPGLLRKVKELGLRPLGSGVGGLRGPRTTALVMEGPEAQYWRRTTEGCGLSWTRVPLRVRRSYGLALPKRSPYYHPLNNALLKLGEDGTLDELKEKWWGEACPKGQGEGRGSRGGKGQGPLPLGLRDVWILLVGVGGACVLGLFLLGIQSLWRSFRRRRRTAQNSGEVNCRSKRGSIIANGPCNSHGGVIMEPVVVQEGHGQEGSSETNPPIPKIIIGHGSYLDLGLDRSYGFPKLGVEGSLLELGSMDKED